MHTVLHNYKHAALTNIKGFDAVCLVILRDLGSAEG